MYPSSYPRAQIPIPPRSLEFIKSYFITNNKNTNLVVKEIWNDFNDGKLNSGKAVNYEAFSTKIIGINKLTYNTENNNYIYE